jgi:hypothetical protein
LIRRALLGALCAGVLAGCGGPAVKAPVTVWEGGRARVDLEYRGEALAVFALGDFNGWNPERHPFFQVEPGRWTCSLVLEAGSYGYLLGIESASGWALRPDPGNPAVVKDATGQSLSLLVVAGDAAGDARPDARPRD